MTRPNLIFSLGFSGTREGMSDRQMNDFVAMILEDRPDEFHHGDCIGSDRQANDLVRAWWPACRIIIHPPLDLSRRANCVGDEVLQPREYLERNRIIVVCCDRLVAAPMTDDERMRSGTWSTVRYARRRGKDVVVLKR